MILLGLMRQEMLAALRLSITLGGAALLAGCAGDGAATAPVVQAGAASEAQTAIEAFTHDPDSFTTKGKPTKTIETPWGPREVYDPIQDSIVRDAYTVIFHNRGIPYNSPGSSIEKRRNAREIFGTARIIHGLDWARLGCTLIKIESGRNMERAFNKDCKSEHNFGSYELSECERTSDFTVRQLGGGAIVYNAEGERLTPIKPLEEEFQDDLTLSCKIWRHEMTDAYKQCITFRAGTLNGDWTPKCFEIIGE